MFRAIAPRPAPERPRVSSPGPDRSVDLCQHFLVAAPDDLGDPVAGAQRLYHQALAPGDPCRPAHDFFALRGGQEDDTARIGKHDIAGHHANRADADLAIEVDLVGPAACRARDGAPAIDREAQRARFIDIARGTVDDHTLDSVDLRSNAEYATPASTFHARGMLDDDHVAARRGFDCRRAQMPWAVLRFADRAA